jgi:hypothetical protein
VRSDTNEIWVDGCLLQGDFFANPRFAPFINTYNAYVTDSSSTGSADGIQAFFQRNNTILQSWSQGITGTTFALNVTMHNISGEYNGTLFNGVHPDIDHFYGMLPIMQDTGIIRYNVVATDNIKRAALQVRHSTRSMTKRR